MTTATCLTCGSPALRLHCENTACSWWRCASCMSYGRIEPGKALQWYSTPKKR